MLAPADNSCLTRFTAHSANHMLTQLAKLGIVPDADPEVTPSESLERTLVTFTSREADVTLTVETRMANFMRRGKSLGLMLLWGGIAPQDVDTIRAFFSDDVEEEPAEVAKDIVAS